VKRTAPTAIPFLCAAALLPAVLHSAEGGAYLPCWSARIVRDTSFKFKPQERSIPAASRDHKLVFAGGTDGRVAAMDAVTGAELWRNYLKVRIESEFAVSNDMVLFGASDGSLYALDMFNGRQAWKYETKAIITSPPVFHQGRVFFQNRQNQLFALDLKTGKWLWHYQREAPTQFTVDEGAAPAASGGTILAGFTDGYAVALNIEDGAVVWQRSLARSTKFTDITGGPAIDDQRACFGVFSEGVQCVDLKTGEPAASAQLEGASAPAAMERGMIVTTAGGELVRLGADMSVGKRVRLGGGSLSAPRKLTGNLLAVSSKEGPLYVISYPSLAVVQKIGTGFGLAAAPAVTARSIYFMTNHGVLYKFARP
jgi:outer membrane protein assembly factor BamB